MSMKKLKPPAAALSNTSGSAGVPPATGPEEADVPPALPAGPAGFRQSKPGREEAFPNTRREDTVSMDNAKAARVAARRNARIQQRYPLLAELLPRYTPEQVLRELARYDSRMEEAQAAMRAGGALYKGQVRALVTAEEFAALVERRKALPPSPEYDADFWRGALKHLSAGR
jgi:hypothetical protein